MITVSLTQREVSELLSLLDHYSRTLSLRPTEELWHTANREDIEAAAVDFRDAVARSRTTASPAVGGISVVRRRRQTVVSADGNHSLWAVISEATRKPRPGVVHRRLFEKMRRAWVFHHGARNVPQTAEDSVIIYETAVGAAERVLTTLNPDYSNLSATAREEFRCKLHRDSRQQVQQELHSDLFGCYLEAVELWTARLFLSDADRKLLDTAQLLVEGIGDNWVVLESAVGWKGSLATDCATLYDWALVEYRHHQREETQAPYPDEDIPLYGPHEGAILIERKYTPVRIKSMTSHVAVHLCSEGEKFFNSITPTTELDSANLEIWRRDWGLEPDSYWQARARELDVEFHRAARGVIYLIQKSDGIELVFSDATVLKAIRIRSFLHDVHTLLRDGSELEDCLCREESATIAYLHRFSFRAYVDESRGILH